MKGSGFKNIFQTCLKPVLGIYYFFLEKKHASSDCLWVSWDDHKNNFGDIITPYILANFTNKKVKRISSSGFRFLEHYFVIGSILQRSTSKTRIWGSGFISAESNCKETPMQVFAVRGPLTRQKLLSAGIECPCIYGDPALLLPEIYHPKIKKKFKLGIIPHYVDKKNPWLQQLAGNGDIIVIDVQQKDPLKVIDDILSCEKIASSSLHGVIVGDAYKIPSVWIKFSDKIVGDGFKFRDYFLSVNRKDENPILIQSDSALSDIMNEFKEYEIDIDLEKLRDSFPFSTVPANS